MTATPMTIAIRALFFASYRDRVGTKEVRVELPEGSTVEGLIEHLRDLGEPYTGLPATPAVALNRTYVGGGAPLDDGDEVAFIPPVAGG